jgi:hypothetical protein
MFSQCTNRATWIATVNLFILQLVSAQPIQIQKMGAEFPSMIPAGEHVNLQLPEEGVNLNGISCFYITYLRDQFHIRGLCRVTDKTVPDVLAQKDFLLPLFKNFEVKNNAKSVVSNIPQKYFLFENTLLSSLNLSSFKLLKGIPHIADPETSLLMPLTQCLKMFWLCNTPNDKELLLSLSDLEAILPLSANAVMSIYYKNDDPKYSQVHSVSDVLNAKDHRHIVIVDPRPKENIVRLTSIAITNDAWNKIIIYIRAFGLLTIMKKSEDIQKQQ